MRKLTFLLCCIILCLTSCKTQLTITNTSESFISKSSKPTIEYIGVKNKKLKNTFFKNFGVELENQHIALNTQPNYLFDIDTKGLEKYNTQNRYISYIAIKKHIYRCYDEIEDSDGLEVAGWCIAGITAFTLVPVYVPMLCAADKNICEISLIGEYQIVVYDTKLKEIVFTVPVEINVVDKYNGQYNHKKTNKEEIDEYYKTLLWNELLKKYDEVNQKVMHL